MKVIIFLKDKGQLSADISEVELDILERVLNTDCKFIKLSDMLIQKEKIIYIRKVA